MGCTTILVGKNASYDGSTLMARNEDSGSGAYSPKKFIVVKPEDQPRLYKSVISKVEITLPDNPQRYTCMPNAVDDEGIWGASGINDANVSMTATETITSNPRVLGADPLFKGGIGEEDLVTITLPYIKSAKEGVIRLGALLKEFGTYEKNGIGFQDENEIWWLESIGGHHFIAKRCPDDKYVVMPNQQGIDFFDFKDAFGEKKNHLCSEDLIDFIKENHLDLGFNTGEIENCEHFDIRAALGSKDDSDHSYNTPRAWYMLKYLNPNTYKWTGDKADYSPESDNLPWSLKPEKKITPEDIKYVLSSHYQGTKYDQFNKYGDGVHKGQFRPIGINRTNFMSLTQIRPYVEKEYQCIEWISMASNAFNTMLPFYTNVNKTPEYLANTTGDCDSNNFYWANRLIGSLADMSYLTSRFLIERYCLDTLSLGHGLISETDKAAQNVENIKQYLEDANEKIAQMGKIKTQELLNKVLIEASNNMKNSFSRSDA